MSKELEEAFRRRAMEKYGYSKGAVSKALEAAIKLWLRYEHDLSSEEEANNRTFETIVNELEAKHLGMYAVIAGGELIAVHKTLDEALKIGAGEAYSHRIVLKVGEKPALKVKLGWRTALKPVGPT